MATVPEIAAYGRLTRVLVHYDIRDDAQRDTFQKYISDANFVVRFERVTNSVYSASVKNTPSHIDGLTRALVLAAGVAEISAGSKVFLEVSQLDDLAGSTIISTEIV